MSLPEKKPPPSPAPELVWGKPAATPLRGQLVQGEEAGTAPLPREKLPRAQPLASPDGRAAGRRTPLRLGCSSSATRLVRKPAISAVRAASPAPSPDKHPGRVTFPPSQSPRRGTLSWGWSGFPARTPPAETHLHPPGPCPKSLSPPLPLPWQPEPRRANRKRGPGGSNGSSRGRRRPGGSGAGRRGREERAGQAYTSTRASPESVLAPGHRLPMKGSIMNLLGPPAPGPPGERGSGAAPRVLAASCGELQPPPPPPPRSWGPRAPARRARRLSGQAGPRSPRRSQPGPGAPPPPPAARIPPSWTPRLAFALKAGNARLDGRGGAVPLSAVAGPAGRREAPGARRRGDEAAAGPGAEGRSASQRQAFIYSPSPAPRAGRAGGRGRSGGAAARRASRAPGPTSVSPWDADQPLVTSAPGSDTFRPGEKP